MSRWRIEIDSHRWNGTNDNRQRLDAARKLARKIRERLSADRCCMVTLVCHSHGGNIALWAFLTLHEYEQRRILGIVSMGTPFLNVPRKLMPKRVEIRKPQMMSTTDWDYQSGTSLSSVPVEAALWGPVLNYGMMKLFGAFDLLSMFMASALAAFGEELFSHRSDASWQVVARLLEKEVPIRLHALRAKGDEAERATRVGALSHHIVNALATTTLGIRKLAVILFVVLLVLVSFGAISSPDVGSGQLWTPAFEEAWSVAAVSMAAQFGITIVCVLVAGLAFGWSYVDAMSGVQCIIDSRPAPLPALLFSEQYVVPEPGSSPHSIPEVPSAPPEIAAWIAEQLESLCDEADMRLSG
ncbi:MAG: DUF2974 domain-containing protein [Gemmatimonas sp.]|nr:DUF2974 domain-containing protein [Gemmatimonas sp.]